MILLDDYEEEDNNQEHRGSAATGQHWPCCFTCAGDQTTQNCGAVPPWYDPTPPILRGHHGPWTSTWHHSLMADLKGRCSTNNQRLHGGIPSPWLRRQWTNVETTRPLTMGNRANGQLVVSYWLATG